MSGTEKQQLQVIQILLRASRVVALKKVPTTDKMDFNVFVRQVQNISISSTCFIALLHDFVNKYIAHLLDKSHILYQNDNINI